MILGKGTFSVPCYQKYGCALIQLSPSNVEDVTSHRENPKDQHCEQDGGDKGERACKKWPENVEVGEKFRMGKDDGWNGGDSGKPSTDERYE
ncbi:hypothetical protein J4E91_004358 [Alternaria rosae]|nr:hypothetical protein J4E91_004358 [Alternaria rosae]